MTKYYIIKLDDNSEFNEMYELQSNTKDISLNQLNEILNKNDISLEVYNDEDEDDYEDDEDYDYEDENNYDDESINDE
jgi:hypothetical protein